MKTIILTLIFSLLFVHAQKGKNVAVIKMVRGDVKITDPDNGVLAAKKGDWIREGAIVTTGNRSVAKLSFIDKSAMNVGPNSQMKVEKFAKDEAGVIEVLSGKIRSQVTKNYMDMEKDKSKLFVKSKSAVMGIRGTDFIFSTNKSNGQSSAVLFEGSVVFNRNNGKRLGPKALERLVDSGVRIKPGQFSMASPNMNKPTFPAKLDSRQFRALSKNKNLDGDFSQKSAKIKNIVPKGLSGEIVSNETSDLKNEIKKKFNMDINYTKPNVDMEVANGGNVDGFIKPPDGSPLHIESASVLPLSSNSTFDKNTGEWRSQEFAIDATGNVVAPEGFKITDEGKILKEDTNGRMKEVVFDIRPPSEQKPLEEMPTQQVRIQGPTPAGGETSSGTGEPLEKMDDTAIAPSGQDWFVPNSQVNQPRFIGPDGTTIPATKVKVKVNREGVGTAQ